MIFCKKKYILKCRDWPSDGCDHDLIDQHYKRHGAHQKDPWEDEWECEVRDSGQEGGGKGDCHLQNTKFSQRIAGSQVSRSSARTLERDISDISSALPG